MKHRLLTLVAILGLLITLPAIALDLQGARSAGLVGESLNGYVEAIDNRADVKALVAEVNAKRKAEYARISRENGQNVDTVAKLAAEQIINRLGAGAYYQGPNGNWKQR